MSTLDQAVRGGWFDIKEHLRRPRALFTHLLPGTTSERTALLTDAAHDLEHSAEGGMTEVKQRRLNAIYLDLQEAEYTSDVLSRLGHLADAAAVVVLLLGLERALLAGDIIPQESGEDAPPEQRGTPAPAAEGRDSPGAEETTQEQQSSGTSAEDVKQIIADVQQIIAADPSAKMDAAIKNILVQLQRYRSEAETFRKLKEQSSGYRQEMYAKTFGATFQSIFAGIRRNYESYLAARGVSTAGDNPVLAGCAESEAWVHLVTQEMEEADRIRSTLRFLAGKHTNLRGPVVALGRRQEAMGALLEREREAARACAGGENNVWRINRLIAREAARRLRLMAGA